MRLPSPPTRLSRRAPRAHRRPAATPPPSPRARSLMTLRQSLLELLTTNLTRRAHRRFLLSLVGHDVITITLRYACRYACCSLRELAARVFLRSPAVRVRCGCHFLLSPSYCHASYAHTPLTPSGCSNRALRTRPLSGTSQASRNPAAGLAGGLSSASESLILLAWRGPVRECVARCGWARLYGVCVAARAAAGGSRLGARRAGRRECVPGVDARRRRAAVGRDSYIS